MKPRVVVYVTPNLTLQQQQQLEMPIVVKRRLMKQS